MNTTQKRQVVEIIEALPGCEPEIGRALWSLEDTRHRTLESLEGLAPDMLDAQPAVGENTISTLLYHIADVEISWLYEILLQEKLPPQLAELFPAVDRDERGILTKLHGNSLGIYLHRLEEIRKVILDAYKSMTLEDYRRPHTEENPGRVLTVTPEWVLHHLMQHEAEHRGQIQTIIEGLTTAQMPEPA